MKLIEKLAEEYSNRHDRIGDSYGAYLEGFRKAREIVTARVRMQITCSRARREQSEFMEWIENAGEEDVNDH